EANSSRVGGTRCPLEPSFDLRRSGCFEECVEDLEVYAFVFEGELELPCQGRLRPVPGLEAIVDGRSGRLDELSPAGGARYLRSSIVRQGLKPVLIDQRAVANLLHPKNPNPIRKVSTATSHDLRIAKRLSEKYQFHLKNTNKSINLVGLLCGLTTKRDS